MSTANSSVSVCSNALLMLGAQTINNFTENNDRARLAANLYPGARDALLREHPWSCAIKRVILAADKERPEYGFSYRFTLPADYIRVLSVGEALEDVEYLVEQRCILANRSSLKLRYVFQNTDVSTYDAVLVDLLELSMAAKMAYAITQSTSMAQYRYQEFQAALKTAKALNGLEYPAETFGQSSLLEGRLNG